MGYERKTKHWYRCETCRKKTYQRTTYDEARAQLKLTKWLIFRDFTFCSIECFKSWFLSGSEDTTKVINSMKPEYANVFRALFEITE